MGLATSHRTFLTGWNTFGMKSGGSETLWLTAFLRMHGLPPHRPAKKFLATPHHWFHRSSHNRGTQCFDKHMRLAGASSMRSECWDVVPVPCVELSWRRWKLEYRPQVPRLLSEILHRTLNPLLRDQQTRLRNGYLSFQILGLSTSTIRFRVFR